MIIIFDIYNGLCNQILEINCCINFCITNNIQFTFRNASFRKEDLVTFFDVDFYNLFQLDFEHPLFVKLSDCNYNENNTYNFASKTCPEFMVLGCTNKEIISQLESYNKDYIVLKRFWPIIIQLPSDINIIPKIKPCKKIQDEYNEIKKKLRLSADNYNFLHYRYEHDFANCFNINNLYNLDELIENINFKDKSLPIYIASTNIQNLLKKKHDNIVYKEGNVQFNWEEYLSLNPDIVACGIRTEQQAKNHYLYYGIKEKRKYKNDDFNWEGYLSVNTDLPQAGITTEQQAKDHYLMLGRKEGRSYKNSDCIGFNFEECAFIDYLFGLESREVYGHNKSSFSVLLNMSKSTNNYYNDDKLV